MVNWWWSGPKNCLFVTSWLPRSMDSAESCFGELFTLKLCNFTMVNIFLDCCWWFQNQEKTINLVSNIPLPTNSIFQYQIVKDISFHWTPFPAKRRQLTMWATVHHKGRIDFYQWKKIHKIRINAFSCSCHQINWSQNEHWRVNIWSKSSSQGMLSLQ